MAEYGGVPEYAVIAIFSFIFMLCYQNIFPELWKHKMLVVGCSILSFILQLLSMGNHKTGLNILGVRVQVLVFVVLLDLTIIFPCMLQKRTREKERKYFICWLAIVGLQTFLFLMASECGTLLVLWISCLAIWITYCTNHNDKKSLIISFVLLIIIGSLTANYIQTTYQNYEAEILAQESLTLFQKIAVKAGQRLFQSDPYQYDRALSAAVLAKWHGNGNNYLVKIPNATTDLPLLQCIQIFGTVVTFFLIPLLLYFIKTILELKTEKDERDSYVQFREVGITGFFIGAFLFSLLSQFTGIIIGIPLILLSRASTWNLTAVILLLFLLGSSDESEAETIRRQITLACLGTTGNG